MWNMLDKQKTRLLKPAYPRTTSGSLVIPSTPVNMKKQGIEGRITPLKSLPLTLPLPLASDKLSLPVEEKVTGWKSYTDIPILRRRSSLATAEFAGGTIPEILRFVLGIDDKGNIIDNSLTDEDRFECQFAFLFRYRKFISPEALFEVASALAAETTQRKALSRFVEFLQNWINRWKSEDMDQELHASVLDFTVRLCKSCSSSLNGDSSEQFLNPLHSHQNLTKRASTRTPTQGRRKSKVGEMIGEPLNELREIIRTYSSLEIANALTTATLNVLKRIKEKNLRYKDDTRVKAVAERNNQVYYWVISSVLSGVDDKEKTKFFTKMVKIAVQLYEKCDFETLSCVVFGLDISLITSSNFYPAAKEDKRFSTLQKLTKMLSFANNYKSYRRQIAKLEVRPEPQYFIPMFGVVCKDLSIIEETVPDYLSLPHDKEDLTNQKLNKINFVKLKKQHSIVSLFLKNINNHVVSPPPPPHLVQLFEVPATLEYKQLEAIVRCEATGSPSRHGLLTQSRRRNSIRLSSLSPPSNNVVLPPPSPSTTSSMSSGSSLSSTSSLSTSSLSSYSIGSGSSSSLFD